MARVGIPRALFYYQYYPLCKTFFEELGAETVVSPLTNKDIFSSGNSRAVADTCLPVKLFLGHVISLADKCDYMFVPAIRSLGRKAYNCSKFIGLPDMTRALIPECPPVLDPEIDLNKRNTLFKTVYDLGRHFVTSQVKIKRAAEDAWKANLTYRRQMSDEDITPVQAIATMSEKKREPLSASYPSTSQVIAVIGHPYIIYDDYITHRFMSRLRAMGAKVVTPEMAHEEAIDIALAKLVGNPHWTFEADIIGAGEYYLEAKINGIITVTVFGCGPDSMMVGTLQRRAREFETPFLHLSLDEHTSEGGLLTRLEAFLDMVKRKEKVCL